MDDLLSRVVRATSTAPTPDDLLDRVAALLLPVADWVLADRLEEPDYVVRVAVHTRAEPVTRPLVPVRARRSAAASVGLLPRLAAAPGRQLRLDRAALERLAGADEPHLAAQVQNALATDAQEVLLLGLVARDELVGVLSLGLLAPADDALRAVLADVALHVGTALDASRLLDAGRAVATAMQTSLLPPLPHLPGLRLASRYVPAVTQLQVGGDWYDAFRTGDDAVLVVGDVRGHDVAAAAQMADLRNLLRAHAVDHAEPPSALLARLERTTDVLGLDVAATCLVARLVPQPRGWRLTWSSAGHLPPVHVTAGAAALLDTPPDLMLGVQAGTARTDTTRQLQPGDTLVLCTDGLVEVREGSLTDRLELLRVTVQEHAGLSADGLAEQLLLHLAPQAEDDVALLVLRVEG